MSSATPDPLYVVKSSSIHNRGVFAARDIAKGERVIEYRGEKISKKESERRGIAHFDASKTTGDGAVYLFILNKKHDLDGSMDWNDARLINHSCTPNCRVEIVRGRIWIVARREIAAGAELTFDYGFSFKEWPLHPCRCGSPRCAGFIVAADQRWRLRRIPWRERARVAAAARSLFDSPRGRDPAT